MLDRLPVHSERDVVDEGAAVDLADVDPSLAPVDECVERPDDVVAVDAEVEREVVASARRDARVRKASLGCDAGDDRLRPVAPGHRQRIGAVVQRAADELLEVGAGRQLDRLDAPRAGLVGHVEARDLPATGARVVEEHRVRRARRGRQCDGDVEGVARGGEPQRQRGHQSEHERGLAGDQQRHHGHRQQGADPESQDPRRATVHEPLPRGGERKGEQREAQDPAPEVDDRQDDQEHERGESERERGERRQSPADHGASWVRQFVRGKRRTPTEGSFPGRDVRCADGASWRTPRNPGAAYGHRPCPVRAG